MSAYATKPGASRTWHSEEAGFLPQTNRSEPRGVERTARRLFDPCFHYAIRREAASTRCHASKRGSIALQSNARTATRLVRKEVVLKPDCAKSVSHGSSKL
jgi:hypothetical protein